MTKLLRAAKKDERGQALMIILVVSTIGMLFITGFAGWTAMNVKAVRMTKNRELALLIAEAGGEYYRWHLAHSPADFQDGTGAAGPYVHNYTDKSGTIIGKYTLTITPPATGSTVVKVKSVGTTVADPNVKRTIEVTLAKPSLAKYAVVANDVMRFGAGTEVFGPIHSNNGIHFDGLTHNIITSALDKYTDPDHTGGQEFAVHTHLTTVDPLPPAAVPSRPDVFEAGRTFPVPAVDFTGITADFSSIKTDAQANGRYFAASGNQGYHIVLKTNDTFDIYRVTSLTAAPSNCTNTAAQTGWGTWSIGAETLIANYAFPANNLIFTEDNLWVSGQINTARLTIAAASFPESPATWKSITVNSDLKYTNYDGQDVIALMAQGNFNVGLFSADTMRIDAAVIAQNGRAGRFYYPPVSGGQNRCSPNAVRTQLTLYGMIGTNIRYGFAYTDNTGYATRTLIYDANLLYAPPPKFPLTSDQYQVIAWKELAQ